jgi:hypothetical protein
VVAGRVDAGAGAVRLTGQAGAIRIRRVIWTAQAALEYREVVEVYILVRVEVRAGARRVCLGNGRTQKTRLEFGKIRQIDVAIIVEIARDRVRAGAALTAAAAPGAHAESTQFVRLTLVSAASAVAGVGAQVHALARAEPGAIARAPGVVRLTGAAKATRAERADVSATAAVLGILNQVRANA